MWRAVRERMTYANVVATLALVIAIGGGAALALPGRNTVDSGDVIDNALRARDIRDAASGSDAVDADRLDGATVEDLAMRIDHDVTITSPDDPAEAIATVGAARIEVACHHLGPNNGELLLTGTDTVLDGDNYNVTATAIYDDADNVADATALQESGSLSPTATLLDVDGNDAEGTVTVVLRHPVHTIALELRWRTIATTMDTRCVVQGVATKAS